MSEPDMLRRGRAYDSGTVAAEWVARVEDDGWLTVTLADGSRWYESLAAIPPDAPCWLCAVGDLLRACIADVEVQARGRWVSSWRIPADDPIERARRDLMRGWRPCPVHDDEGAA